MELRGEVQDVLMGAGQSGQVGHVGAGCVCRQQWAVQLCAYAGRGGLPAGQWELEGG